VHPPPTLLLGPTSIHSYPGLRLRAVKSQAASPFGRPRLTASACTPPRHAPCGHAPCGLVSELLYLPCPVHPTRVNVLGKSTVLGFVAHMKPCRQQPPPLVQQVRSAPAQHQSDYIIYIVSVFHPIPHRNQSDEDSSRQTPPRIQWCSCMLDGIFINIKKLVHEMCRVHLRVCMHA
jgi:hypothetical protein